ncbi:MAG: choice-of-anchor D domain-containing protein [Rhodocyclaceae bacterium]|nr:choice-of-anchor D domain-containing protein [Rhodocyclaceae bacterium]
MTLRTWITLPFLFLYSAAAFTFSSAPYMPLADGNSWAYLKDGVAETQTVQPGTYWINGAATKMVQQSSGDRTYATNDASGIREHMDYVASVYVQGYGYTSATQTLNPPIRRADAETSIGATVYQSGTDTLTYAGIGSFPLSYYWTSTIAGYETVTVPAGTFTALRVDSSLLVYGYIGGSYVSVNGTDSTWVVANLGSVKSVNTTNGVTETRVLTSSNLLRPIASLTPGNLNFGTQTQNTTGSPQTVVLSNIGTQTLNLWALYTQPSGQFPMTTDCGGSLAAGASCNIQVSFAPLSPGSSQGSLYIYDNANDSPQSVSLYGIGTAPVYTYTASASPASLGFGNQRAYTSSASRAVTFTNTGTGTLAIPTLQTSGYFSTTNDCQSAPLAPGASCTIYVTYTPLAAGSQNSGTLTITTAANGPQTVALSGTATFPLTVGTSGSGTVTSAPSGINCGATCSADFTGGTLVSLSATPNSGYVFSGWGGACFGTGACQVSMSQAQSVTASFTAAAPVVGLSYGSIQFNTQVLHTTSASQTLSLANSGNAVLAIASISASGDFGVSHDCGASLAPGAFCTLSVNFTPTATGLRTGALTVSDNAAGSPHTVSLSGTGQFLVTVNLVAGWNLLGNGGSGTVDVASLFGDANQVVTVWKWLPGATPGWAFYTPSLGDGGANYAAGKGYAFLTTINSGEGFWVNAKQAFSVSLGSGSTLATAGFRDGSGVAGANPLATGWSLIAVGDNPTPRAFANGILDVLATPPGPGTPPAATTLTSLWAWYPGNSVQSPGWFFYAPSLDNSGGLGGYIGGKGYLDFGTMGKTLDPATGFWVNHP